MGPNGHPYPAFGGASIGASLGAGSLPPSIGGPFASLGGYMAAHAARSKSFEGNPLLPNPAAMAAAAAAARPYLPSPYLPNFPGAPYRHPLLGFATPGYNLAATPFHSLLAGLSRPKLDEYQSLLNSAAAAAGLPPPPPVGSPPTSTGNATSPTSPDVTTNKSNSSNPPSPIQEDERKTESINALRLKAREHEARLEESVKNE